MIPSYNDIDDEYYAMKIIKRSKIQHNKDSLISELEALKKLSHPNIIKLYEIIDDPKEPNIYLILDLMEDGSIESQI